MKNEFKDLISEKDELERFLAKKKQKCKSQAS